MPQDIMFAIATVAATFFGPIAAVQAQKWIEQHRSVKDQKIAIFRTLIATQKMGAWSDSHIEALNLILITFTKTSERRVVQLWRRYFDHLCTKVPDPTDTRGHDLWGSSATEHLANMLAEMGKHVGFPNLDPTELKRSGYDPNRRVDEANARLALLKNFAQLTASGAVPMNVVAFPFSKDAADEQAAFHKVLLDALRSKNPSADQ